MKTTLSKTFSHYTNISLSLTYCRWSCDKLRLPHIVQIVMTMRLQSHDQGQNQELKSVIETMANNESTCTWNPHIF